MRYAHIPVDDVGELMSRWNEAMCILFVAIFRRHLVHRCLVKQVSGKAADAI